MTDNKDALSALDKLKHIGQPAWFCAEIDNILSCITKPIASSDLVTMLKGIADTIKFAHNCRSAASTEEYMQSAHRQLSILIRSLTTSPSAGVDVSRAIMLLDLIKKSPFDTEAVWTWANDAHFALCALPDAQGWLPIESAPRDGTEVVLLVKSRAGIPGKCLVGHYMPGGHCIEDHPAISDGWYFWNGCMFDHASAPTHWMPLPPSPPQPAKDKSNAETDGGKL